MNSEKIRVYYPLWVKVLGVTVLPVMVLVAIWFVVRPVLDTGLTDAQNIVLPIVGIAILYQCMISFRCFKYLNSSLLLHDKGVDLCHRGKVIEYKWGDLTIKHYTFATTTQIKTKGGETVAYFSDGLPNLSVLEENIANRNI